MRFPKTLWLMFALVKGILTTQFLCLLCKMLASKSYEGKEALKRLKTASLDSVYKGK